MVLQLGDGVGEVVVSLINLVMHCSLKRKTDMAK